MSAAEHVLAMRGVHKSFTTPRGPVHVLRSLDLVVEAGEFSAITGPSGSGKSTFLNLASLLDQPTSGEVLFEGQDTSSLREAALSELRKNRVGMVFQNFNLLTHRTALENVMFRFRYFGAPAEETRRRSEEALEMLGVAHLAAQPARLLSGGEMQRVAIARAVAVRPKLLLADEPTGNLDRESAETVMAAFTELNRQGISILLATHNMNLLEYCSRHLVCRDGRIEEHEVK